MCNDFFLIKNIRPYLIASDSKISNDDEHRPWIIYAGGKKKSTAGDRLPALLIAIRMLAYYMSNECCCCTMSWILDITADDAHDRCRAHKWT